MNQKNKNAQQWTMQHTLQSLHFYTFLKTNDDNALFSDIDVNIFTFFTFFIFLLLHITYFIPEVFSQEFSLRKLFPNDTWNIPSQISTQPFSHGGACTMPDLLWDIIGWKAVRMHKLNLVSWGKIDLVTRQDLGLSPLRCERLTRRSHWVLHLINEGLKQVTRTSELVLI